MNPTVDQSITVYSYGPGGADSELLAGANWGALSGVEDYESPRALALFQKLEANPSDEEMVLGLLPDGRWALTGLTVEGHQFAIEDTRAE